MFDAAPGPDGLGSDAALCAAKPARVAFVSTFPPQQCGLATFCQDMRRAVEAATPLGHPVVPVAAEGAEVARGALAAIAKDDAESYRAAGRVISEAGIDAVVLQHEFGIFGGPSGEMVLGLMDALSVPVVSVLHTILPDPTEDQRRVLTGVIERSARLVTMARVGRDILMDSYGVPAEKIAVIPHGYPERAAPADRGALRGRLGYAGRRVLLTFGLLGPSKGLEHAIDAMPKIAAAHPDALYVIAGATHPGIVAREGEAYRESLIARAARLGVAGHVRFLDAYLDVPALLDQLQAADVYVTPYLSERQITSGTLSFAFGMGLPIVSTPYWHAAELLDGGLGRLVPFQDAGAIADAVCGLFGDEAARAALRARVAEAARGTSWPEVGARIEALCADVARGAGAPHLGAPPARPATPNVLRFPDMGVRRAAPSAPAGAPHPWDYMLSLCDDTGIAQHARFKVADRAHGYCIDDCARVLIAAASEPDPSPGLSRALGACAAFTEHAWNEEAGRFRNFMAYDRTWLEEAGSEDSTGRAIWALGHASARADDPALADWAEHLYRRTRDAREDLVSLRALAFCVLGEAERRRARDRDERAVFERFGAAMIHQWAEVAEGRAKGRQPAWRWFETALAYDNARLPQALLAAAEVCGRDDWRAVALEALGWLHGVQDRGTHLNLVGTRNFGRDYDASDPLDEQPIDAAAMVDACAAAYAATGDAVWRRRATDAFAWFGGRNRLGASLVEADGACADGLHGDRINANRGAESVLAYAQAARTMAALGAAALPGADDTAGERAI